MLTLSELSECLTLNIVDYEIIKHEKPIISVIDAKDIFDIDKAAPIFILKSETFLFAFISCSQRGRIDFKLLKKLLNYTKLSFANKKEILDVTGYEIGNIPLIGHGLPCILDRKLLNSDFIYGGTGDPYRTLKISPKDVLRLNNDARVISFEEYTS